MELNFIKNHLNDCLDEDVDDLFLFVLFCFFLGTFPLTVSLCIIFRFSVATIRVIQVRSE